MYKYGEEISYDFNLLKVEDYDDLQLFTCGNSKLDAHIQKCVVQNEEIVDEDGLYFVFRDLSNNKIIAIVSLATSGIVYTVTNYMHVLPAIKIDVLAVELRIKNCIMIWNQNMQKMRMSTITLVMISWEQ